MIFPKGPNHGASVEREVLQHMFGLTAVRGGEVVLRSSHRLSIAKLRYEMA